MSVKSEKDKRLLEKIVFRCNRIQNSVQKFGLDYDIFLNNADYQDSVSMNILQIGEYAGKLSDNYVKETTDFVDWRAIKGMRNYFAHAYDSMDFDMIWHTVKFDIPKLKAFCESELKQ